MAKTYRLRAAKGMQLDTMQADEIEQYVSDLASRGLEMLPDEVRPATVNAVALESMRAGSDTEWGIWAEWSRACCDRRDLIEEFEEPVVDDFAPVGDVVASRLRGEHVEAQLRVQKLQNPQMHRG